MLWIVLYVWVGLWTALFMRLQYKQNEPYRWWGSLGIGLLWPLGLPLIVFFEFYKTIEFEEDKDV